MQVGQEVTLRLIKRPRDSILATALSASSPRHPSAKAGHHALSQSLPQDPSPTPARPDAARNGHPSTTPSSGPTLPTAHEPAWERPDAPDGLRTAAKQPPGSETRGTPGKQGKAGQNAAWQVASTHSLAPGSEMVEDTGNTSKVADNQFAKFTPLSDAGPLWQTAATELAEYATLV